MKSDKIGLLAATVISINTMVGAGIFSAPAKLASRVGPAGIITYLFVIAAIWCMAFSFAQLASHFPEEGAFYAYATQWGGHTMGVITSFAYMLGIVVSMGLLAQLEGHYLHDYFPSQSPVFLGALALAFVVTINLFGTKLMQATQIISILCTCIPLLSITLLCLSKADVRNLTPFAPHGFLPAFHASFAVIYGFFGFESTTALVRIVDNPQRNVPRALSYAVMIVSLIYLSFITSVMLAIPSAAFASSATPLSHPLLQLFPQYTWIAHVIHFTISVSFLSVLNALTLAMGNLFLSLAQKTKTLKHAVTSGILNQKNAMIIIGLIALSCHLFLKNIDLLFSVTALFMLSAFISAFIALFTLRKRTHIQTIQASASILIAATIFYFALVELSAQIHAT